MTSATDFLDPRARRAAAQGPLQLDTEPHEAFDALARAAALACDAPGALVALTDGTQVRFKAWVGEEPVSGSAAAAVAAHALAHTEFFEQRDLSESIAMPDGSTLRFAAAVPIILPNGEQRGALCVMDARARELAPVQRQALQALGIVASGLVDRQVSRWPPAGAHHLPALSETGLFPFFAADNTGRLTYANDRWDRLFGRHHGDDWLQAVIPGHRERVQAAWCAENNGHQAPELDFSIRDDHGSVHHLRALWRTLHDDDGQVIGRAGIVEDVTSSRDAGHQREHLNARLNLESERKNRFIATLAHELRGPLSVIRNGLRLLRTASLAPADASNVLGMMERQVTTMTTQIDGLTDLSSISLGKLDLRMAQVDMVAVVDNALEIAAPLIEAKHHTVERDTPLPPVFVKGDAARLVQIVTNLLTNAAKYTDDGGRIEVTVRRQSSNVLVQIKDNGVGLTAEQASGIFAMFEQVQDDAHMRSSGLGIGLALSRRLAALHGADISVTSEGRGRGSCFTLTLPGWADGRHG